MRIGWAAVVISILLATAGCGNRGFELPDGRFDRAGYRAMMVPTCEAGMRSGNSAIPEAERSRFCACLVDRILADNDDDAMRAQSRDSALRERAMSAAGQQCGATRPPVFDPQTGRWTDSPGGPGGASPDDEPPPPDAPPPPPPGSTEMPAPVVQPVDRNGAN